ncbi:uncharacterized protein LOC131034569 [Cryptomeria japonica]|uniref:uncharacterized protein LOC131034569 n=1 Tax=Cryptomeria japonica TaxID=3369 RepID=UPI0025AD7005|nr:uncharacterized protein LOC131034569 [Cryptomeria japonica]
MVGANVKAETKDLIDRRSGIEQEMNVIIARLCAGPNGPGLTGNLVDSHGFPQADIDIPAVRSDRNRLAMLRNDHKDITEKIEQNLHILLSGGLVQDHQTLPQKRSAEGEELGIQISSGSNSISSISLPTTSEVSSMDEDAIPKFPFAVVDELFDGSPAALDGLQLGDQILKFGMVEGGDNLVPRLAREGQTNQGRAIPVIVMRRGVKVHLNVTPRAWSGRGLLGCHLQSL